MDVRVRALESLLVEKGYIDPAALDTLIETYETKVGPHNGARVVAKAWVEPDFRQWLLADATAAIASLGYTGRQGEHMRGARRTRRASTTWSSARCAPATRGRCWVCRPSGTSRRPIAARAVIDPRGVLADFGVDAARGRRGARVGFDRRDPLPGAAGASGRHRALERGTACRHRHARFDDRHRLAGSARPARTGAGVNGVHDMGGVMNFGPVVPERNEPPFHHEWERRAFALTLAMGATGQWNLDQSRDARERSAARALSCEQLLPDLDRRSRAAPARARARDPRRTLGRTGAQRGLADRERAHRRSRRDRARPRRVDAARARRTARFIVRAMSCARGS